MPTVENHLIARLPARDRKRLQAACEPVQLSLSDILCEPGTATRHVYFPTGGFIYGREGIKEAYHSGRGIIQLRARAMIEPVAKGDRESIIITEIPFQVNKARLVERIAELHRDGKLEGISDLRDESDKDGMRIVVELKKATVAGVVLNQLYAHTAMQSSFGVIMLAIVGGQPRTLNLKQALQIFTEGGAARHTVYAGHGRQLAPDQVSSRHGLQLVQRDLPAAPLEALQ